MHEGLARVRFDRHRGIGTGLGAGLRAVAGAE